MKKLFSTVRRGSAVGTILRPHRHADGCFVVSTSRYAKDYIRISSELELPKWVAKGYSVRMSNPSVASHRAPSLISPASIEKKGS